MHIVAAVLPLSFALSASAHTIFQRLWVNGVDQGHTVGIRVPSYDGPITDVTSNDVICNGGINPFRQPVSKQVITVPAGATVTAEWHHTLDSAGTSDASDPIDKSHKGPVITYLARVPDATQSSVTGLKWFKIQEEGYNAATQQWAVDRLYANKGKISFQIPSCIPAGQYLMRHELIALHGAGSYPGAQLYMECAQLQITGGGNASPATVSFPGAYKGTDPGIKVNIYGGLRSYVIPGPPVFSCNGAPSSPVAEPPALPPAATTVPAAPQPTTAPGSGGGAQQWAQCGGVGFTGPTTCVAPFTCNKMNDYYSQCQ